jgi:hypothetical protein
MKIDWLVSFVCVFIYLFIYWFKRECLGDMLINGTTNSKWMSELYVVHVWSWYNSVTTVTAMDWILFRILTGANGFLFAAASEQALTPTQPLAQWARGSLSPEVKRPVRERSLTAILCTGKECREITTTLPYIFISCCLIKIDVTVQFLLRDMCTGFSVLRIASWSGMCKHDVGTSCSVTGNLLRHLTFAALNVKTSCRILVLWVT